MRWLGPLVMSLFVLPLAWAAPAAASEINLKTDATSALFGDGVLSTHYRSTRCLQVKWTENTVPRLLGVSANVNGALAPYLTLKVEVGSGGNFASCSGFSGQLIYDGTIGDFGASHPNADAQLMARRITAEAGSTTFRLTVSVMDVNEAQSRTATADFIFAAVDESRMPTPPSPNPTPTSATPDPAETPDPATTPDPSATPDATPTESSPGPVDATETPGGGLPSERDGTYGSPGPSVTVPLTPRPEEPESAVKQVVQALQGIAKEAKELVQQAAVPVAKGLAWSAWSLPLILLFLLLQNNIDGRDPKLAEAPAYADRSLPFDDRYDTRANVLPGDPR